MTREDLLTLGASEEVADRILKRREVEEALKDAGVRSMRLALSLIDEGEDVESQITALRSDEETSILFEPIPIRGVSPSESAEEVSFDSALFEERKHDANWINRNWDKVAEALKQGRLK